MTMLPQCTNTSNARCVCVFVGVSATVCICVYVCATNIACRLYPRGAEARSFGSAKEGRGTRDRERQRETKIDRETEREIQRDTIVAIQGDTERLTHYSGRGGRRRRLDLSNRHAKPWVIQRGGAKRDGPTASHT